MQNKNYCDPHKMKTVSSMFSIVFMLAIFALGFFLGSLYKQNQITTVQVVPVLPNTTAEANGQ